MANNTESYWLNGFYFNYDKNSNQILMFAQDDKGESYLIGQYQLPSRVAPTPVALPDLRDRDLFNPIRSHELSEMSVDELKGLSHDLARVQRQVNTTAESVRALLIDRLS